MSLSSFEEEETAGSIFLFFRYTTNGTVTKATIPAHFSTLKNDFSSSFTLTARPFLELMDSVGI